MTRRNTITHHRFSMLHKLLASVVLLLSSWSFAENQGARELFESWSSAVFQIQVIDNASGDKSSIGSGFQISKDGLVATNYHVVSQYVDEPKRFHLLSIDENNQSEALTLLAIDVIHDLAIVKINNLDGVKEKHFSLANIELSQGDQIFSMGNPHDLGMTIIDGTYNGFLKASRFDRILFSGSLNAGMSGGPAFNTRGEVIGINVAKGGEQLSFLVPVKQLSILLDSLADQDQQTPDFKQHISEAVLADQDGFYQQLLNKDWKSEPMANLKVPGEIDPSIRCWGGSNNDPKRRFERVSQECRSQDNIYVSRNLSVSHYATSYIWLKNIDLSSISFAFAVERNSYHDQFHNARKEEDITNFHCRQTFMDYLNRNWKVHSCIRAYKNIQGLFDYSFVATSVDAYDEAAVLNLDIAGISRENIKAITERFLQEVSWPTP